MTKQQAALDLDPLSESYDVIGELSGREDARSFMARRKADGLDVLIFVARTPEGDQGNALSHLAADANLLGPLSHPGLLSIVEGRWLGTDAFALVTERVKSPSLHELLSRREEEFGFPRIAAILRAANGVLEWARERKVVHRGITPETLFVEPGSDHVCVAFAISPLSGSGVPGADSDARCVAALARAMFTRSPAAPERVDRPLEELRPGLPKQLVEETAQLLQASRTDAPDVTAYIARIAMAEALKSGEEQLEATRKVIEEQQRVHKELMEKERGAHEQQIAAERKDHEREVTEQAKQFAKEREDFAKQFAKEREDFAKQFAKERDDFAKQSAKERETFEHELAKERKALIREREALAKERASHAKDCEALARERESHARDRALLLEERARHEKLRAEEREKLAAEVAALQAQAKQHAEMAERRAAERKQVLVDSKRATVESKRAAAEFKRTVVSPPATAAPQWPRDPAVARTAGGPPWWSRVLVARPHWEKKWNVPAAAVALVVLIAVTALAIGGGGARREPAVQVAQGSDARIVDSAAGGVVATYQSVVPLPETTADTAVLSATASDWTPPPKRRPKPIVREEPRPATQSDAPSGFIFQAERRDSSGGTVRVDTIFRRDTVSRSLPAARRDSVPRPLVDTVVKRDTTGRP